MASFAGGKKRISQETFDEVVQENIEEFEMDKEEAIQEAREQFERQGVDLSAVDASGSDERKEERKAVVAALELLAAAAKAGGTPKADLLAAAETVERACRGRGKAGASARATVVAAQGL